MSESNGTLASRFEQVPIGAVASPVDRTEEPKPGIQYRQVGVRLWGEGAYERETIDGSETKYRTLNRTAAGDIIVNKIWARNGSVSVVQADTADCYCSGEFPLFAPDRDRLDPRWFYWVTKTRWFWHRCDIQSRGTSGKNRIRPEKFLAIKIPLPPLAEQRRIVEKVERLAGKIEEACGVTSALVTESSVLLSALLHSKLAKCDSNVHPLPLKRFVESHDSGWSPQCENQSATNGEWAVLKTTCVQWSGFDATANKVLRTGMAPRPEICVKRGDVLITRAGPMNRVGVACVVQTDHDRLMLSDKIVRLRMSDAVEPAFVPLILGSQDCQEYFRQGKTGLAASQVNISRPKLLDLPIIMPRRTLQQKIVEAYYTVAARVRESEEQRIRVAERLKAMLPSILDRAFRGEL